MPEKIGPHLLGRLPSPPDERDYKLGNFLGTHTDLVNAAYAELTQTTVGYKNKYWETPPPGTHWAQALAILSKIAPFSPAPTPTPTPTPPPPTPTPPGDVILENPEPVLDQGDYGTCVGNGCAQWGNTLPINDKYVEKDARAIYYEATKIDGQPDDPDAPGGGQQGTYVRSGMKALQARGRLKTYAATSSVDEIRQYIGTQQGPVVIGIDWYNDMFETDVNGYVKPTGGVAGGHCVLLIGNLESEGAFLFLNSWGDSWGQKGYFKMKYADFDKLLQAQGEAWAAVELAI